MKNDEYKLEGLQDAGPMSVEDVFGPEKKVSKREYVFFDNDGNIVSKDSAQAKKVVVTEYDELGKMLSESFGEIEKSSSNTVKKSR